MTDSPGQPPRPPEGPAPNAAPATPPTSPGPAQGPAAPPPGASPPGWGHPASPPGSPGLPPAPPAAPGPPVPAWSQSPPSPPGNPGTPPPAAPPGPGWADPPPNPPGPPAFPPSGPSHPEGGPPPRTERQIGKYILRRELGRGGMGAVYLAEQPGLGREVAIKELIVNPQADPTALTRFVQEARVMARASHPNLVQIFDLEEVGNAHYIVLEYVRGQSLRHLLNRGRVPLPQTFAVMHAVLQALNYAHRQQIVHRDMKPENVLLSDSGEVKVADFGIARLTDDTGPGSHATKTGTTVGTPQYMSPEQVASSRVDGRSDLYSAGIMLYELVCGRAPFTATEEDGPFTLMAKHVQSPPPPPTLHVPGLDPELEEVMLRSLSKRPEERYQTGAEFDAALSRAADRLAPGWPASLEPGADLSAMRARDAAPAQPLAAPAPAYNPAPPVRAAPARARGAGCLGVLVLVLATSVGALLALASAH